MDSAEPSYFFSLGNIQKEKVEGQNSWVVSELEF